MVTEHETNLIPKISDEFSKMLYNEFPNLKTTKFWLSNDIFIVHNDIPVDSPHPETTVVIDKKNKDWILFRRYDVEKIRSISKRYTNPKRVMASLRKLQ